MVQNKKEKSFNQRKLCLSYLGIWVLSVGIFWIFKNFISPLIYYVFILFLLLPGAAVVISIIFGKNGYWGNWKWIIPVFVGIMNGGCWMATFGFANTLETGRFNLPDINQIIFVAVLSAIGILIGACVRKVKNRQHEIIK